MGFLLRSTISSSSYYPCHPFTEFYNRLKIQIGPAAHPETREAFPQGFSHPEHPCKWYSSHPLLPTPDIQQCVKAQGNIIHRGRVPVSGKRVKNQKKHSCRWTEVIPVKTTRGLWRDKGYGSVTLRCYGCRRSKYHTESSNGRFHPSSSTRQYAVIDRLLSAGHAFTRTAEQALRRNLPLTGERVPSRQQVLVFFSARLSEICDCKEPG